LQVIIGQNFVVPAYSKVSLHKQPMTQDSDEELEYADNSFGTVDISYISSSPANTEEIMTDFSEMKKMLASEVGDGGAGFIWSVGEGGYEEEWRHSVAPIPEERLVEFIKHELEISNGDDRVQPISGELEPGSIDDSDEDVRVDSDHFEKEVEATFLRAVNEDVGEGDVILEVNSLKLSYNRTATDCAGALFYAMMKLPLETSSNRHSPSKLVKAAGDVISKWKKLLKYYLCSIDEEIEVILKFEEMCSESAKEYFSVFTQILHLMYEKDVVQEEAILNWASEKEEADESDKVLVKQAEKLIQ
ncbi:hypothetical protein M569_10871, partial [Genlisea aurea]